MAIRLTEEEVHIACAEIASQGERPTSLNLLDKLGRGSLTTITKYLNSWNKTDDAQAIDAESLPTVVQLPSELSKEGEDLLKKMWNVAKTLTDKDLEVQREALKQAEIANQKKVEEAFKFSEAQSMKIERLEENFSSMKNKLDAEFTAHKKTESKLNGAEKENVGLSKDNEQLQNEIQELKNKISSLEESNKAANQNKQALQDNYSKEIKAKDAEIRTLEIELSKVNEKLASSVVEIEKINTHCEGITEELKTIKTDFKKANEKASDAEKLVAKLEGKLEVYKSLEKPKKEIKDS